MEGQGGEGTSACVAGAKVSTCGRLNKWFCPGVGERVIAGLTHDISIFGVAACFLFARPYSLGQAATPVYFCRVTDSVRFRARKKGRRSYAQTQWCSVACSWKCCNCKAWLRT